MSLTEQVKKIPHKPGCYLYKDKEGEIIYIGKAKDLFKRVSSYFQSKDHDKKTRLLIKNIADIDYIITSTELEALLLEAQLIKKHQPKYNIDLKAGERYSYIKITADKYPRLLVTRNPDNVKKGEKLYGPYASGLARQTVMETVNKLFKLRTCKTLPKKPCLLFHIKRCSAPCIQEVTFEEYADQVAKAERFLQGDLQTLISDLEVEMRSFSEKQEYEKAKFRLAQIQAIQSFLERQKVSLRRSYNQDVINYIETDADLHILVFHIQKGIVSGKKEFTISKTRGTFESFLSAYYYDAEIPEEVIVPHEIDDQTLLEEYLTKLKEKKVVMTIPQKGDKKKLLELVHENIEVKLDETTQAQMQLQDALSLPKEPVVIECFDISNIREKHKVGSMVYFSHGKPDKNNYRRFKIKYIEGQDDVACMNEVVFRRYYRLLKEQATLPDLIVIDGGKGQLGGAKKALDELKVSIPMIGLAKKNEEIFLPGLKNPIVLSKKSPGLKLLQRVRDEAHRFALKYHRLLRQKGVLE